MKSIETEVVVIGGGPAGAACATVLADHGRRVLLIERSAFPRFHIGESLMPDTYWPLQRIGMLEKLRGSNFVKKFSVQFFGASGRESAPFYFDEMNPHECSQTWQVLRSEFDRLLLQNAIEHGVQVLERTNVVDVLHDDADGAARGASKSAGLPRLTGVVATGPDGAPVTVHASVVVDATGTNAMLARRFNLRQPDPKLRKASLFAHYQGAYRDPNPRDEGATLILQVKDQAGWFWYIPLPDDIVSIGVVADIDYLIKGRGPAEATLAEEIERCPIVQERLRSARRVSPVHVLSDFSYNAKVCAGDGWVLIGDAFTFLDPMYSSGVFLALKSGELAGDAIHDALRSGDLSAARLGTWGPGFYEGVQTVRKLVYAFYTKDFSFGQFNRAHPEHRRDIVNILVGNVFREDVSGVFGPMSKYVEIPESIKLEQPAGPRAGAAQR